MSWIERAVEQQLAAAIERGELETPAHLKGKPLDLDTQRGDGWWAEQFVRKERSQILRDESQAERGRRAAAFWRAPTIEQLDVLVAEANEWVAKVNARLLPADALEPFQPTAVRSTWAAVRPS